jgi:hypothetical protein
MPNLIKLFGSTFTHTFCKLVAKYAPLPWKDQVYNNELVNLYQKSFMRLTQGMGENEIFPLSTLLDLAERRIFSPAPFKSRTIPVQILHSSWKWMRLL